MQVAHSEVSVVESVVSKRFLGYVYDFGPLCVEIVSESILQLLICNIFGNCDPDLIKVANGNQAPWNNSSGFIKIDR